VCCPHALIRPISSASAKNLTFLDTTTVRLRGGAWELEAWPDRGGRIVSLSLGGDELLDQGIGVDDPEAAGYVAAGARGWDEMVPTIDRTPYPGPGEWEGVDLPDHGEAWRLPWQVVDQTASTTKMQCLGRVLPWRLERSIDVRGGSVRLEYVYENVGRIPLYAYWCAHPLFRYEPGMEVDVEGGFVMPPPGASAKVFLPSGTVDHAQLSWPSGSAVEMAWDSRVTPYVAIWSCNGDLGGYRHVAIEPATGGHDRPDPAAPPPLLAPGGRLSWWLEVRDRRQL
jgi:galactose mutarotase-like enzyme